MEIDSAATPHFCPICGDTSIEMVSGSGTLTLFRCGKGHFFTFERKNDQDQKNTKLARVVSVCNEESAIFRAARQRIESSRRWSQRQGRSYANPTRKRGLGKITKPPKRAVSTTITTAIRSPKSSLAEASVLLKGAALPRALPDFQTHLKFVL